MKERIFETVKQMRFFKFGVNGWGSDRWDSEGGDCGEVMCKMRWIRRRCEVWTGWRNNEL